MQEAIKLLAMAAFAALAVETCATESISVGGVTLRDGGLYNKTGRPLVAAGPDPVVAVTVSAGGRYVVFVRQREGEMPGGAREISMWIHDRWTGRRKQVGRGLGYPCCEIATSPADTAQVFGKFEPVNGAYWSSSQQVLVRFIGSVHVLTMDGSLQGDV